MLSLQCTNWQQERRKTINKQSPRTYEKESILRTFGAVGMSMNNELEKKDIRLLASKLDGTSIADSFTVSSKYNLLICGKVTSFRKGTWTLTANIFFSTLLTFSFQASDSGGGNLIAPAEANNWYCWSRGIIPSYPGAPWMESTKLYGWKEKCPNSIYHHSPNSWIICTINDYRPKKNLDSWSSIIISRVTTSSMSWNRSTTWSLSSCLFSSC